jgi:hypothetical protein
VSGAGLVHAALWPARADYENTENNPHEHPTEWPDEISLEPSMPHPGTDPVEVTTEPRAEHPERLRSDRAKRHPRRADRQIAPRPSR